MAARTDTVLFFLSLEKLSPIGCVIYVIDFNLGIALTKESLPEWHNFVSLNGLKKNVEIRIKKHEQKRGIQIEGNCDEKEKNV